MLRITTFLILAAAMLNGQAAKGPKTFASPEEARDGLLQAAENGWDSIKEFFGPNSGEILHSGDPVMDKAILERFNRRTKEKAAIERDDMGADRATLVIGKEDFPFPIPLIRKGGRWSFDLAEGKTEIRNRIIGRNELDTIHVCDGYVSAQLEYADEDRDGNGIKEYARLIFSTPGKKDGLYWPGEDSPVAENFAKAVAEGYSRSSGAPKPYHGYHYKILTGQGANAEGGERDYLVRNLMIGGFALVAWPAEYGVSGIMTFQVNQDGRIYEKDLGPGTAKLAGAMTKFNPDKSWTIVIPTQDDEE